MTDPLRSHGTRLPTPQSEPAIATQVPNNAGGYVFELDPLTRATRFLILGTTGGTYYAKEQEHTKQAAEFIIGLANDPDNAPLLLRLVQEVSLAGRAPKQNPTLFTLAALASSRIDRIRAGALELVPEVCRTGTMLFIFITYLKQFRGLGRGVRSAISKWYTDKEVSQLAYQAVKYRQREGWTHRDLLRLTHPKTAEPGRKRLFDWICGRDEHSDIELVDAYQRIQTADPQQAATILANTPLPWEAIPDTLLSEPTIWTILLPGMGLTALIRNLGRLTSLGVIAPFTDESGLVATRLINEDNIRKARIHPFTVLNALATYNSGRGFRGKLAWTPVPEVVRALNKAFYISFGNIEPADKRTLVALDISPSMDGSKIANSALSAREAACAMAMTVVRTEPEYMTCAFAGNFQQFTLTPEMELTQIVEICRRFHFDRTDCSVPIMWALQHGIRVDTFIVYTDNETWSGRIHPFQAINEYRDKTGIDDAKLVVVGMTATNFTIANPSDRGMLDVVGFDTAAPTLISDFSRGNI